MRMAGLVLRRAILMDVPLICEFVRQLADYEDLLGQVVSDENQYSRCMFTDRPDTYPEALIAEYDGSPVGFAVFTQLTDSIMYLEDLYVSPESRGQGAGIGLLAGLAREAGSRGVTSLRWICLDWNKPSLAFYESLGATVVDQQLCRLQGRSLLEPPGGSVQRFTDTGVVERLPTGCRFVSHNDSTPLASVTTSLSFSTILASPVISVLDISIATPGLEEYLILVIEHLRREAIEKGYSRMDILLNTEQNPVIAKLLVTEFDFQIMPEWVALRLDGQNVKTLANRAP